MADGSGGDVERTTLVPEHLSQLLSPLSESLQLLPNPPLTHIQSLLNWGSPINSGSLRTFQEG